MSVAPARTHRRSYVGPSSPYLGLVPFGERDAAFFFGRSHEVAIVSANLRSSKLTVVYGPSGVGKSSLLNAGVVHDLRNEADEWADERPFAVCAVRSWLDDPIQTVAAATRDALEVIAGRPLGEGETLSGSLREWTRTTGARLLLVLDQFEEYFQYWPQPPGGDPERLTGFDGELASIVNDSDLDVNVLISIREDAWSKLDRFEGHIPRLFANYLRVDNLDVEAAREAIVLPIETWNRLLPLTAQHYEIEDALVKQVLVAASGGYIAAAAGDTTAVSGAAGGRIEAPFLQLLLERLWRATVADKEHTLTSARLAALGGADRIVENHILDAIARLSESEKAIASDCFRFLISSDRTKIAQRSRDLADWTRRPESQVTAALGKLCGGESGRILRAVAPPLDEPEAATYELFHDVLAAPILAWRRGYEARRARKRLLRVAGVLLAVAAVFAGISILALIERHQAVAASQRARFETGVAVVAAGRATRSSRIARHLYHQQQALNRLLRAEVAALTKRRRAAAAATAAQTALVAELSRENAALTQDVQQLRSERGQLHKTIAQLRAANRATGREVSTLNTENTATAAEANALPSQLTHLSHELASLRDQHGSLVSEAGIMSTENAARRAQYNALVKQVNTLLTHAKALGYMPYSVSPTRSEGNTFPKPPPRVTAPQYSTPGGPSSSDALSRLVAELQQQLAALLAQRARLNNEVAWLRRDNALLIRERAALAAEIAGLRRTELGLEAEQRRLQQSLVNAEAEHAVLSALVARRKARNSRVKTHVAAQTAANRSLQAHVNGEIDSLGVLQGEISGEQSQIKTLIAYITPPVTRLETAAKDPAQTPSLAGLLAVEAYNVRPYANADATAHPGVYNALWVAFSRLNQAAALALVAPVAGSSNKIATTISSVLVKDICALETGGFTLKEWKQFLPSAAPYTAQSSQPCRGA